MVAHISSVSIMIHAVKWRFLEFQGCFFMATNDGVSCPADFANTTQFHLEKTEQKLHRIP